MKQDQLEKLIALAEWAVGKVLFAGPVVREAQATLAAMQTQITAKVLEDAGWKKESPNTQYRYSFENRVTVTEDFGHSGVRRWMLRRGNYHGAPHICYVYNMYDLGEIVRILGCQQ